MKYITSIIINFALQTVIKIRIYKQDPLVLECTDSDLGC